MASISPDRTPPNRRWALETAIAFSRADRKWRQAARQADRLWSLFAVAALIVILEALWQLL